MKHTKAKPEEVWLHQDKYGLWNFSFDPPLKRYELGMVRMVNATKVTELRAEVRRLREDLKRKNTAVSVAARGMSNYAVLTWAAEVDLRLKKEKDLRLKKKRSRK